MLVYFFIINIISFIVYGIDKLLAIRHKYRISENTLLLFGLSGGFFGSLLAMYFFRHKTKKGKFLLLNILFFIVWVVVYIKVIC